MGGAEGGGLATPSFTGVPAVSEPRTLLWEEVAEEEEEAGWNGSRIGHSPEKFVSRGNV